MIFIGIDIGWINLAFVKTEVDDKKFQIKTVIDAICVDLNSIVHNNVSLKNCKLHHSNDAHDKIQHLLQEYSYFFENVDKIFIERQPVCGLTNIEQLIFGSFRDKAILLSPRSMHKFFEIGNFDYETRKLITTKIAAPYLKETTSWKNENRLHDMGDAFCLLIYALHLEKKNFEKMNLKEKIKKKTDISNYCRKNMTDYFDQFKCKNKSTSLINNDKQ